MPSFHTFPQKGSLPYLVRLRTLFTKTYLTFSKSDSVSIGLSTRWRKLFAKRKAFFRLSKKSVGRVIKNVFQIISPTNEQSLYNNHITQYSLISIQERHKHRVYAVLSHFSAKRVTTLLSKPTDPFHENRVGFPETSLSSFGGSYPSFFEVWQRVDRFIDTLKHTREGVFFWMHS